MPEFDALASKFLVATRNVHDLSFKDAKLVTGTEGSLEKETKQYLAVQLRAADVCLQPGSSRS